MMYHLLFLKTFLQIKTNNLYFYHIKRRGMILGIVLCGIMQHIYVLVLMIHFNHLEMTKKILTIIIMHTFFVFLLGFASSLMNGIFYKRNRYKRNIVGLCFSIAAVLLCILLFVYGILYRQAWFR